MGRYAQDTEVSSDKSRAELERVIARYGADAYGYMWEQQRAVVQFRCSGRFVRFVLSMPERSSRDFTHTPGRGLERSAAQQEAAYEQAVRQRWRALVLVVKAKLEAVESGITTFDEEFMAHLVLPNNQTVAEFMVPQIAEAYETGEMPRMLPQLPPGS